MSPLLLASQLCKPKYFLHSSALAKVARPSEIAAWYRRLGSVVVLGGPHVQACPDEAAEHADTISLGNGVVTWPRILADVETGCLRAHYESVAQPRATVPQAMFRLMCHRSGALPGCATTATSTRRSMTSRCRTATPCPSATS
jgi:hypothetical protein